MMADLSCLGHGGGHTTWTCRTCEETVYGPPLNTHCSALEGPAAVRISTSAAHGATKPGLSCTDSSTALSVPASAPQPATGGSGIRSTM
jgi:hypothetical protein